MMGVVGPQAPGQVTSYPGHHTITDGGSCDPGDPVSNELAHLDESSEACTSQVETSDRLAIMRLKVAEHILSLFWLIARHSRRKGREGHWGL